MQLITPSAVFQGMCEYRTTARCHRYQMLLRQEAVRSHRQSTALRLHAECPRLFTLSSTMRALLQITVSKEFKATSLSTRLYSKVDPARFLRALTLTCTTSHAQRYKSRLRRSLWLLCLDHHWQDLSCAPRWYTETILSEGLNLIDAHSPGTR